MRVIAYKDGMDKKQTPHNDLRTVEAKLRALEVWINDIDPVWSSLDSLWDHVVLGPEER